MKESVVEQPVPFFDSPIAFGAGGLFNLSHPEFKRRNKWILCGIENNEAIYVKILWKRVN